jgi:hypothetical protein
MNHAIATASTRSSTNASGTVTNVKTRSGMIVTGMEMLTMIASLPRDSTMATNLVTRLDILTPLLITSLR